MDNRRTADTAPLLALARALGDLAENTAKPSRYSSRLDPAVVGRILKRAALSFECRRAALPGNELEPGIAAAERRLRRLTRWTRTHLLAEGLPPEQRQDTG